MTKGPVPLLFSCLLFLGCAGLPVPTAQDLPRIHQRWPQVRLEDLQTGRKLFVVHCSSCHTLHSPSQFSEARWEKIMVKMQPKAKIDDPTSAAILTYLSAFSSPAP